MLYFSQGNVVSIFRSGSFYGSLFFFKDSLYFNNVYVSVSVRENAGALGVQKKMSNPSELEFKANVSYLASTGAGNGKWVLCKSLINFLNC